MPGVFDDEGSVSSALANIAGNLPHGHAKAEKSDWITVTGVRLDVSLFWIDGKCPELDTREEVKRRFDVIRVHGQSVVRTTSPHYVDGTWGNMSTRGNVPLEIRA